VVSSSSMLRAFMAAGLTTDRFAYCGSDWGKSFLLDERDQICAYVDEGRGVGG
jgi:hypothetical protein